MILEVYYFLIEASYETTAPANTLIATLAGTEQSSLLSCA